MKKINSDLKYELREIKIELEDFADVRLRNKYLLGDRIVDFIWSALDFSLRTGSPLYKMTKNEQH